MTHVSTEPPSTPQRRRAQSELRIRATGFQTEIAGPSLRRFPLGAAEVRFDGITILTAPGLVMTPVPTTEALVEWAAEWIGSRSVRVADIGTGSGAIAVALALRTPAAKIWATDDSEPAIALARANVARHGLEGRVQVLLGDLLDPVPGELDLVVANLPYHAETLAKTRREAPAPISRRMRSTHPATASATTAGCLKPAVRASTSAARSPFSCTDPFWRPGVGSSTS